jgi:predicted  nucleic acid-binding Zn-ribbon protein
MAHPCIHCGGECYCSGSWDDIIVDHTPKSCKGCGCESFLDWEDNDCDNYWDDDEEDLEILDSPNKV